MNWEQKIIAYFKRRRLEMGMTGPVLAEKAGVSQPLISMMETGKRSMSVGAMIRLAGVLDVDLEDLFGKLKRGEDLGPPPPREIEIDGVRYVMADD